MNKRNWTLILSTPQEVSFFVLLFSHSIHILLFHEVITCLI